MGRRSTAGAVLLAIEGASVVGAVDVVAGAVAVAGGAAVVEGRGVLVDAVVGAAIDGSLSPHAPRTSAVAKASAPSVVPR